MKSLFSKERMIRGFVVLAAFAAFADMLFEALNVNKISLISIFTICALAVVLVIITKHVKFDSEKLILWSLFSRKEIELKDIKEICRKCENFSKGTRLEYWLFYFDAQKNENKKVRLYLPEDYKNEILQELLDSIKNANNDFKFTVDVKSNLI